MPYLKVAATELLSSGCLVTPYDVPILPDLLTFFSRSQESGFLCEIRFFFFNTVLIQEKGERSRKEKDSEGEREEGATPCESLSEGQMSPQWSGGCPCAEGSRTQRVEAHGSNTALPWKGSPGFIRTTLGSRGL